MSSHLTPIQVCEALFGSIEDVGRILGRHPKTAYLYRHASGLRDAGDLPSARHMRTLLARAAAQGIPLTADHLIWGASAEDVAALVAQPAPDLAPQVAAQ